jgi:SAM-dependent methyltransferase
MKRQSISAFFRSLGMAWVFDYVRYHRDRFRKSKHNRQFKREHPGFTFPPPYMIYESFQMDYARYYISGQEDAQWIIDHVAPHRELKNCHILDWGCGPARTIRHMPAILGASNEYFGTDYNPATIQWCKANVPVVQFSLNELNPPLPFENEIFDLVYGISVFTHLSEQSQHTWSVELHRILKPGGIAFVTTLGDAFKAIMTAHELSQYEHGAFVERANVKEGHRMYAAFHPPSYIRAVFEKAGFTILEHVPSRQVRPGFISQDVWVLRK